LVIAILDSYVPRVALDPHAALQEIDACAITHPAVLGVVDHHEVIGMVEIVGRLVSLAVQRAGALSPERFGPQVLNAALRDAAGKAIRVDKSAAELLCEIVVERSIKC